MDERDELMALRRLAELEAKAGQPAAPITRTERFAKGLRDPVDGGAQLLTKVLPSGVVEAGNRFNNWLADKTGLVGRLPEGGVDQQVREDEAKYQARRQATPGADGFDWMRLGGNVLNPANVAIASRLPAAASVAGRAGVGATGGGLSALMNPVTSGDFGEEKLKQVAIGTAFGGATPAAANAVSRIVSPNASINPQLQLLRAEGVRPTIGQTLGGRLSAAEEKLMSVPIAGDAIARARQGSAADLNRAAYNRALKPVGDQLPKGATGREAVQYVEEALGKRYDKLLPNLTLKADSQLNQELSQLRNSVNTGALDPNVAKTFNRILQNDVLGKFRGQQALTGQTLKDIEGDLGAHVRRFAGSQDADQRLVGDALQEVQAALRRTLERANPQQAKELKAVNTGWANFKRLQKAAASVGAEDGNFTPAQLQSAVKSADRSKDKGAFARGNALMQDLSEAGKTVLGGKVPNSGTADRLLMGGAPLAAIFEPTAAAAMAAGPVLYSRPVQNLLAAAVANRPQAAQPVANALRQSSPFLVPLSAQMGLNALNQ